MKSPELELEPTPVKVINAAVLSCLDDVFYRLPFPSLDDLEKFFNENIKGRKYSYCVIGKKADLDMEALGKLGTVKELTLEELFGY